MANSNFVVHNGLTVGPLTIDAETGSITTTGTVDIQGGLSTSAINKNNSSISINDTGTGSNVAIVIDGTIEHILTADLTTLNTALTASGNIVAAANTPTTSSTTGALVVVGGVGIGGALNVAGATTLSSALTYGGVALSNSVTGTGSMVLSASPTFTGTVNASALTLSGDLIVNGTTTTINATTLTVDDKNIELGSVASPSNATADGGGITLKGTTDKTFNWVNATTAWTSSEDLNLLTGKVYEINGATVLTATGLGSGVVSSSLTSVGTITAGIWNGTTIAVANGGTGITSFGAGIATFLGTPSSANLLAAVTDETGTGALVFANSPTFTTQITTPVITKSGSNGTGDIGQSNNTFATVYATTFSGVSTTAKYADLAENYQGDKAYAPGTVIMFGGDKEVTIAEAETTQVAGVVSTNPAHLMNGGLTGATVVALALQGRVPCNVIGPVKKGDMIVSAGFGYAKASTNPKVGQVIGKALNDFTGAKGQIEVVVGRV